MLELRGGDLERALHVGHGEARPPGKIMGRGRTARREVPARHLQQRRVALQRRRRRRAFLQQRICKLLSPARAAAHHGVQLCPHHQVAEPLTGDGLDARTLENRANSLRVRWLPSRSALSIAALLRRYTSGVSSSLRSYDAMAAFTRGRGEREHPADVGRRHEMPRGPHDVRSQDRAVGDLALDVRVGQAARSLAQRPLRAGIVLRLHGTEGADDLAGIGRRW